METELNDSLATSMAEDEVNWLLEVDDAYLGFVLASNYMKLIRKIEATDLTVPQKRDQIEPLEELLTGVLGKYTGGHC